MTKPTLTNDLDQFLSEAEVVPYKEPAQRNFVAQFLRVALGIPLWTVFGIVTVITCFMIWWSRYGDEAFTFGMYGIIFLLKQALGYTT
jgi:hypothetical protein